MGSALPCAADRQGDGETAEDAIGMLDQDAPSGAVPRLGGALWLISAPAKTLSVDYGTCSHRNCELPVRQITVLASLRYEVQRS